MATHDLSDNFVIRLGILVIPIQNILYLEDHSPVDRIRVYFIGDLDHSVDVVLTREDIPRLLWEFQQKQMELARFMAIAASMSAYRSTS